MTELGFSARAYDNVLKVGRTIADPAEPEFIQPGHISKAIQHKSLEGGVLTLAILTIIACKQP